METHRPFILASASPRRSDLLRKAGYQFTVEPTHVEEPAPVGFPSMEDYVAHVAFLKANACRSRRASNDFHWILAADTSVAVGKEILGKPTDRADAKRILLTLSGTTHDVMTGLCLYLPRPSIFLTEIVRSVVEVIQFTDAELERYLDTGLWDGKAGAYGIQDDGDPFARVAAGSFSNIVGLPMERLAEIFSLAERLDPHAS